MDSVGQPALIREHDIRRAGHDLIGAIAGRPGAKIVIMGSLGAPDAELPR